MKIFFRIFLAAYEYVVFYIALLWFGLICLGWSLPATVLYFLLPGRHGRRLGRVMIMAGFRVYVASLAGRCFRFDLSALDALRGEKSLIIAANHPSLWDAILLVSRLPVLLGVCLPLLWIPGTWLLVLRLAVLGLAAVL